MQELRPSVGSGISEAWLRSRTALVVTTGSNLRRDELGSAIVTALLRNGEVSAQAVEVQADADNPRRVRLHVGQRVRLQRQVMGEGLGTRLAANGETAVLERVDEGGRGAVPEVHLRFDDGRLLQLRSDALVATHGYACSPSRRRERRRTACSSTGRTASTCSAPIRR